MNRRAGALFFLFIVFRGWGAELNMAALPEPVQKKIQSAVEYIRVHPEALDQVDEVLRTLMSTGMFESVEAHRDLSQKIQFITKSAQFISELTIVGNRALSTKEIKKVLELNINDPLDRKKVLEVSQRLKSRYSEIGYINTTITVDFVPQPENKIGVIFSIQEGPECKIREIRLDVQNNFLAVKLRNIAKSYVGYPFAASVLSEFQARVNEEFIAASNRYLNASLSAPQTEFNSDSSQVVLSYKVTDPYRVDFLFKGNEAAGMDDDTLRSAMNPKTLTQMGFNLPTEAGMRLRDYYLNAGYAYVSVNPQVREFEDPPRREILFHIDEGPRVQIRRFLIQGQISRPPQYYADFISDHSSDLIRSGYYNERDLEKGTKNLITELRNQGFFKARIQSINILEGPRRQWVEIQLAIYEGPLTQIDEILFTGNKNLNSDQLRAALTVKKGGALHLNELEESIQKLREFYLENGYLEMQILNSADSLVTYNRASTHATIHFRIYEGPRISVSSIIIDGNEQTQNSVILRELKFKVGDPLTPSAINASVAGLQRLGLFSKIEIETFEKGTPNGPRTIIVRLAEKNPGLLKFGIGLTNENNLNARGYLGVSYRNLWGTARSVSLRLEQNKAIAPLSGSSLDYGADFLENKVTAGYFEPFITLPFDSHVDGRMDITRSQTITAYPNPNLSPPFLKTDILESNSIDFVMEKNFSPHFKLTWTVYGFSHESKFHVYEPPRTEEDIARIGPSLTWDYRNDIFNPTQGHFIRLGLDYSAPWMGSTATIEFLKSVMAFSYYQPFKKSWVWANSLRGGYIKNLSSLNYVLNSTPGSIKYSGVPYQQLFTIGTRSTIRGFDPASELIPRLDDITYNLAAQGIPTNTDFSITDFKLKDETYFYLIKSELRFPIYGSLGGTLFYDGGAVIIPGFSFEDEYRDSAGFGLRFITPVGPVNFELAYKLDPILKSSRNANYSESKYQFHFSIGSF